MFAVIAVHLHGTVGDSEVKITLNQLWLLKLLSTYALSMARHASRNSNCSVVMACAGGVNPCIPRIAESAQPVVRLRRCRKERIYAGRSAGTLGWELEWLPYAAHLQNAVLGQHGDEKSTETSGNLQCKESGFSPAANLLLSLTCSCVTVKCTARGGRVPKAPHVPGYDGRGIPTQNNKWGALAG